MLLVRLAQLDLSVVLGPQVLLVVLELQDRLAEQVPQVLLVVLELRGQRGVLAVRVRLDQLGQQDLLEGPELQVHLVGQLRSIIPSLRLRQMQILERVSSD